MILAACFSQPRLLLIAAHFTSLTAAAVLIPLPAQAQSAENVAVVVNDNSPDSQRIADYYVRRRGIPSPNVIHVRTSLEETIDRNAYLASIESPVTNALTARSLQDRVLYIVLTKDIPLRIAGDSGPQGTVSSVDSEMTLIYRRMSGVTTQGRGRIDNPYYLGTKPIGDAKPFTHRGYDIFLVTRLDGFTVDDVIGLIDRASSPARNGKIVLDQQDKLVNRMGEDWLEEAAKRLTAAGQSDRVLLERTVKGVRDVSPVLGYYSWGSNDPRNRERHFKIGFVPGAIAGMFVSSDARTFKEPAADWVPSDDSDKSKWFAGTPQSLIGDLIRDGVTGVSGHVAEPYLESTVRPEILFPAYLEGLNLAEAFYAAMPHLSWQNIVIGDPLCAPFRERPLDRSEVDPGVDERTGLPKFFSARRTAVLKLLMAGVPDDAVFLTLKAETLITRGDRAGARAALEEATQVAPQAAYAHLQLAMLYEVTDQVDQAIDRYRRVVALQPQNAVALNNLAYSLATRRKAAAEALPLAERALATAPQNPALIDTVAWIEHLLGRDEAAARRIAAAVSAAPASADIRLHSAIINAAAGARAVAEKDLQAALKLQPELEGSADVKQLKTRLQELAAPQK
jgi:uncharacterized protein (TIGR03790 family)